MRAREISVDNFAGGGGASTGIEDGLGHPVDIAINHDREAIEMHKVNHPDTRHYCENVWDIDPRAVTGDYDVGLGWFSPDCTHHSKARGRKPFRDRNRARRRRGLAWLVQRWIKAGKPPRVFMLENVEEFADWGPLLEDGTPDPARRGMTFRRWHRYVVDNPRPFIVPITHHGDSRVHSIDEPVRTVTTASRGEFALISPTLIQQGWGERHGQAPRILDIHRPLGTIMAEGNKHALVCAFLAQHNGGMVGHYAERPLSTITSRGAQQQIVTSHIVKLKGTSRDGQPVTDPLHTIQAGGLHYGEVRAFLLKYYGTDQDPRLENPLATITTKDRFGLVTVYGEPYAIVDIGMRMLTPRELYRAQGFGDDYIIDPIVEGKPLSKTAQVRMCGNSVSPPVAKALVQANLIDQQKEEAA